MDVDNLGNIYVVDQKNRMILYDQSGMMKFEYFSNRLGQITDFDVRNPLEILVFFGDYNIIKLLDNTLAEVQTINLATNPNYVGSAVVCKSNDDSFWVVDPAGQKIVKLTDQLKVVAETNRFTDLGIASLNPLKIREAGNKLMVMTEANGFWVFDNFGQFIKKIPSTKAKDFQFDGKGLLYETMTGYRYQKIQFPDFTFMSLPIEAKREGIIKAKLQNKKWIIGYPGGIDLFKTNN